MHFFVMTKPSKRIQEVKTLGVVDAALANVFAAKMCGMELDIVASFGPSVLVCSFP